MKFLILVSALVISSNALATGGFWCEYKGQDGTEFQVDATTSRSFANAIVSAQGHLKAEVQVDGKARKIDRAFTKEDIRQYWNANSDLRVLIYSETTGLGDDVIWVSVVTTQTEEGSGEFKGKLSLSGADWTIGDVDITCGAE